MYLTPRKSTIAAAPFSLTRVEDRINNLQREMNNLMSNFFTVGDVVTAPLFETGLFPSVDVVEKENKYLLDAEVPGMKESEIDIDFKNNTLIIRGEKKSETETKDADYFCVERSYGAFSREIPFDEEIDPNNIKADLKDGVLHIELLKTQKEKSARKRIPIRH